MTITKDVGKFLSLGLWATKVRYVQIVHKRIECTHCEQNIWRIFSNKGFMQEGENWVQEFHGHELS